MSSSAGDLLETRRGAVVVTTAIIVLFLIPRLALLFARDPFFDEIFTLWIGARSVPEILEALRLDSGPPLYYFLVKPLVAMSAPIEAVRLVSVAAAVVGLVLILSSRTLGPARYTAAALLAVHPAAALFAADARSYALCGALVLAAVLLLESDRPSHAAIALAAAAYSHYYGVLFFPALLLRKKRGAAALALAVALFIPGFVLAWSQPAEAMGWSGDRSPLASLNAMLFISRTPASLFAQTSWWPVIAAAAALVVIVAGRSWRFVWYVAIPIVLAAGFTLAGRPVYFPMRFESVLAAPLVLWMATALHGQRRWVRRTVVGGLMAVGFAVIVGGIGEHLRRPVDPYRRASNLARAVTLPGEPLIATGYCYLETAVHQPDVIAFPSEQAAHPGWRAVVSPAELAVEAERLPSSFLWVGERTAPELPILQRGRRWAPVAVSEHFAVARFTTIR